MAALMLPIGALAAYRYRRSLRGRNKTKRYRRTQHYVELHREQKKRYHEKCRRLR